MGDSLTRGSRAARRAPYQPAPAPSGTGLVDALFSELERRRLEAATAAIGAERQKLAEMSPPVATGAPDAIITEMTDELARLRAGQWSKRLVRGCVLALRRDPDGRRVLAIAVPETRLRAMDGWVRAVASFHLWSKVIWCDEDRAPDSPVFIAKEALAGGAR